MPSGNTCEAVTDRGENEGRCHGPGHHAICKLRWKFLHPHRVSPRNCGYPHFRLSLVPCEVAVAVLLNRANGWHWREKEIERKREKIVSRRLAVELLPSCLIAPMNGTGEKEKEREERERERREKREREKKEWQKERKKEKKREKVVSRRLAMNSCCCSVDGTGEGKMGLLVFCQNKKMCTC